MFEQLHFLSSQVSPQLPELRQPLLYCCARPVVSNRHYSECTDRVGVEWHMLMSLSTVNAPVCTLHTATFVASAVLAAEFDGKAVLALGGRHFFLLCDNEVTCCLDVSKQRAEQPKKHLPKADWCCNLPSPYCTQNSHGVKKLFFHSSPSNLNRSRNSRPQNMGQRCYFCSHLCVFVNLTFLSVYFHCNNSFLMCHAQCL